MVVFEDPEVTAGSTNVVVDTIMSIFRNLDAGSGSVAGIGITLLLSFVAFSSTLFTGGFARALTVGALVGAIVAFMVAQFGILSSGVVYLFLVLLVVGLFLLYKESS